VDGGFPVDEPGAADETAVPLAPRAASAAAAAPLIGCGDEFLCRT